MLRDKKLKIRYKIIERFSERLRLSDYQARKLIENIESMSTLFLNGYFNQTIDHAYYALHHALNALNALAGFYGSGYRGVRIIFKRIFIKCENRPPFQIDPEIHKFLSREGTKLTEDLYQSLINICRRRNKTQYAPYQDSNFEETRSILIRAAQIVEKLLNYQKTVKEFLWSNKGMSAKGNIIEIVDNPEKPS